MKFFKLEDCDVRTVSSLRDKVYCISLDRANALYDAWLAKGKVADVKPSSAFSALTFSLFGLNEIQVDRLKSFYESQTGNRATDIGKESEDSAEKIVTEWLEWVEPQIDMFHTPKGKVGELMKRAKALLAKKGE